jgi:hypothetical protein
MDKKKTRKATGRSGASELRGNELRIRFDHPRQLLSKVLQIAQALGDDLSEVRGIAPDADDVLGAVRARIIVSHCAASTAWLATLGDLGLNPLIFRNCVAEGVDQAGFQAPDIPATLDTRLIDVVAAIQEAPRK